MFLTYILFIVSRQQFASLIDSTLLSNLDLCFGIIIIISKLYIAYEFVQKT